MHRGAYTPRALAEAARLSGQTAVALTDLRGLYGAVAFRNAAREAGVRPLFGASFNTPEPGSALVALARDESGFANLCRLITADQLARPKPGAEAPAEERSPAPALEDLLVRHGEGLILLTSDPRFLRRLRGEGFGPEALFAELFPAACRMTRNLLRRLAPLAGELGLRTVATCRVHFLTDDQYATHRLLAAIRTRKTLDGLAPEDLAPPSWRFATTREAARLFHERPDAVRATRDVAERCDVDLPIGPLRMPRFEAPDGEAPETFLTTLCREAVPRFYATGRRRAAETRLERELGVICAMGYAPYFLIVWDLVRFARGRGIPSTGRGSAADSLVSYLLGLTHVDPVKHELYFERFLNPERSSPPDIDIDLCWRRRGEVVDYVYRRWGAERVAMISTHATHSGRSCVREAGKALGMSEDEIGRITRFLPHWGTIDFESVRRERPEARHIDFNAEPMRSIMPLARRIEGFPSHLGVHPSGIVVSPEPLTQWVPLERATKGLVVTQYDMYPVEDLGLLKIDLLGQRSLSVIADVCAQVREERDPAFRFRMPGEAGGVDPEDDADARRLLAEGRSMGVFQVESPAMRGILRKVRADDFETVTAASSVIRPGPKDSGMLRSWVRRHCGQEAPEPPHPRLTDLLAGTHGIMIYQEDVLKVAQAIAGFSLGRADMMRRSMSDKRPEEPLAAMEAEFMEGARRTGVAREAAATIWKQMRAFAGYAFCKAHSASYTVLSFQSAWLKTHFPAEFMAAVLANGGGYYDRAAYVSEARRLGLRLLGPSLSASERRWTGRAETVRCGLDQIKGLRERTCEELVRERAAHGPYRDVLQAFERLPNVEKAEWDLLIACGACDDLATPAIRTRPQMLWTLDRWFARKRRRGDERVEQLDLLRAASESGSVRLAAARRMRTFADRLRIETPDLPELSFERRFDEEARILETPVRCHPLERFRAILPDPRRAGLTPASRLQSLGGRRVRTVGWMITNRRCRCSNGGRMQFLCLEDKTGVYEAILFDRAYRRFGHLTVSRGPFLLTGRVEDDQGHCTLHVDNLERAGAA